eukprot:COSAG02_NODE_21098_length_804_cov_1.233286_1_plen_35_part_01
MILNNFARSVLASSQLDDGDGDTDMTIKHVELGLR